MTKFIQTLMLIFSLLGSFNANALLIKLDFSTIGSSDKWGNITNDFDITQASGLTGFSFDQVTHAILAAVQEDYYSTSYAFIDSNQQLDIDFMIAPVTSDVSSIDGNNYTVQIGSAQAGNTDKGLGVACTACIKPFLSEPINSIFASVFSNTIFNTLASTVGGLWDLTEVTNAIAGTLSHEIGHALGLSHPGSAQTNPGESLFGIMGTGYPPTSMPNAERLKNRAFSHTNMAILVNNLGLRSVPIPEPSTVALFLISIGLLQTKRLKHS